MKNKIIYTVTLLVILSLSSMVCFAAEDNTVILGNEITKSIDKATDNVNKVISGEVVGGSRNVVEGGIKGVENVVYDTGNMVKDGINNTGNMIKNDARDVKEDAGNYNAVRTTTTEVSRSGIDKDTMTTWMWITLIAATTIIIAAIWYYVTQYNS